MRDSTKVLIGLGCIWGIYVLGALVFAGFTLGENDSMPERIAFVTYGLTMLPVSVVAIWHRRTAAGWLLFLAALILFGFSYQVLVADPSHGVPLEWSRMASVLIPALVPACLGFFLMRGR